MRLHAIFLFSLIQHVESITFSSTGRLFNFAIYLLLFIPATPRRPDPLFYTTSSSDVTLTRIASVEVVSSSEGRPLVESTNYVGSNNGSLSQSSSPTSFDCFIHVGFTFLMRVYPESDRLAR
jgi:hypothetical protein